MKILICGSRQNYNYKLSLLYIIHELSQIKNDDIIIHGGAIGIDTLVEAECQVKKIKTKIIKPDYTNYQYRAPLIRDFEMVKDSDKVIALWNGISKGTKYTYDKAIQLKKITTLYFVGNTS